MEQNRRRKPKTMTTIDTRDASKDATAKPLSRRQPMSRLLPEGSPGAVVRWVPTQWPRPGGKMLVPLPDDDGGAS